MAHSGRCFRSNRRTARRKFLQGKPYEPCPTRWKVPEAIRGFLTTTPGSPNQVRAQYDQMGQAIARYAQHQRATGKGPPVRAAGSARGR